MLGYIAEPIGEEQAEHERISSAQGIFHATAQVVAQVEQSDFFADVFVVAVTCLNVDLRREAKATVNVGPVHIFRPQFESQRYLNVFELVSPVVGGQLVHRRISQFSTGGIDG